MKEANVEFRKLMADVEFKCDFAFLADILSKLNDLKVTLQGKDVFEHEMYNAVKSFSVKLNLFSQQVKQSNLAHFVLTKGHKVDEKHPQVQHTAL